MPIREADATWEGSLLDGRGTMRLAGGACEGLYSYSSRFDEAGGTNPEELLAAAHAGCFSMALAHHLTQAGFPPTVVHTVAKVHLQREQDSDQFSIPKIELETEAEVPNIEEVIFQQQAELAKQNCPLSKVLAGAEISLVAQLKGRAR